MMTVLVFKSQYLQELVLNTFHAYFFLFYHVISMKFSIPISIGDSINPFSTNVPFMDKSGSWFLLAKCLKNTRGRVTF